MDKIIFIGLIVALFIIVFCLVQYIKRERDKTYNELRKQYKEELEKEFQDTTKKIAEARSELTSSTEEASKAFLHLQEVTKEIKEKESFNQTLYKVREEELDKLIENKKKAEFERVGAEIKEWANSAQSAALFNSTQYQEYLREQENKKKEELNELTATIDDYKARRDVINQEILRARAIEEKQDFYRIQLPKSSKEDMQVLNDIRQKLNKTDLLNKLIYENYIARPTKEMVKRVLEGKNPCGIYKVTNIETKEVYIGKSTKISDRFQNHVKSACGLEGVAESQFQRALKKYGVDNFTWELLEEVPKENLSEREKYYIMFYGTKDYGYNQREG